MNASLHASAYISGFGWHYFPKSVGHTNCEPTVNLACLISISYVHLRFKLIFEPNET